MAHVEPHLDDPGRLEWWARCCTSLLYLGAHVSGSDPRCPLTPAITWSPDQVVLPVGIDARRKGDANSPMAVSVTPAMPTHNAGR
jgi:hypothetical protein